MPRSSSPCSPDSASACAGAAMRDRLHGNSIEGCDPARPAHAFSREPARCGLSKHASEQRLCERFPPSGAIEHKRNVLMANRLAAGRPPPKHTNPAECPSPSDPAKKPPAQRPARTFPLFSRAASPCDSRKAHAVGVLTGVPPLPRRRKTTRQDATAAYQASPAFGNAVRRDPHAPTGAPYRRDPFLFPPPTICGKEGRERFAVPSVHPRLSLRTPDLSHLFTAFVAQGVVHVHSVASLLHASRAVPAGMRENRSAAIRTARTGVAAHQRYPLLRRRTRQIRQRLHDLHRLRGRHGTHRRRSARRTKEGRQRAGAGRRGSISGNAVLHRQRLAHAVRSRRSGGLRRRYARQP